MMNKCAKFHKDGPSAIELSETALYRNLMQASNFGGTFDQLSFEFF